MAVGIIASTLDDNTRRKGIPNSRALHFEADNALSLCNLVPPLRRPHDSIARGNQPEVNGRLRNVCGQTLAGNEFPVTAPLLACPLPDVMV